MKIAILTSVFFQQVKEIHGKDRIIFGGAERYLIDLVKFLQADGHEVTVYQAMHGDQIIHKQYNGVPIECLPVPDTWELHVAPNLNHAFYEMARGADLRIYFASFLAWPAVQSPCISINHGIFWDYTESLATILWGENRTEFFRRQLHGIKEVDACVAVDTNVRNVVAAMEPGAERKVHYVPNFVDTELFRPDVRKWNPEHKTKVLFPRRLVPLRGINEFMLLAADFPECDFLLCGQAFSEDAEGLLAEHQEKNQPNVRTIMRPMEQMPEVYQEADIAVIPTRAAEGTSLSCLEAMATGLPIITTPAGGLPNLVIDRWNGLVVDLNHDLLTPALKTMISNPEMMERYGRRNRQMAVECFDVKLWRDRWRKVIERTV